jgi:hypothetical protein
VLLDAVVHLHPNDEAKDKALCSLFAVLGASTTRDDISFMNLSKETRLVLAEVITLQIFDHYADFL